MAWWILLAICSATSSAQSLHPTGPGSVNAGQDHSRVSRTDNGTFFVFASSKHDDIGPVLIYSDSRHLEKSFWEMKTDGTKGSDVGWWVREEMWDDWFGAFWAPDVLKLKNRWFLYYSVARNLDVDKTACIGFATSETPLVTTSWVDHGSPLVCSYDDDDNDFHAIDPAVLMTPHGELWLSFGGQGGLGGIYALQLNETTGGLRLGTGYDPRKPKTGEPNNPFRLANAPGPDDDRPRLEASSLDYINGWYYLYYNRGDCCAGCDSTYNIRVVRSRNVTGPYKDSEDKGVLGEDAAEGEMFYDYQGGPTGKWIGPGHFGRYLPSHTFSVHYYNGDNTDDDCPPAFEIRTLLINDDGWVYQQDDADTTKFV